jgi:hypothetical protein
MKTVRTFLHIIVFDYFTYKGKGEREGGRQEGRKERKTFRGGGVKCEDIKQEREETAKVQPKT